MADEDGVPPSLPEKILNTVKKCLGAIVKSAPLEPGEEVGELLEHLNMSSKHVHQLYIAFHNLRQLEVPNAIVTSASEVECKTLIHLVDNRKRWVRNILRHIVEYGGCVDVIDWDHFLYIFLRFCSLSKIELCQVLFFIIVKDSKTAQVNYLTDEQLMEYYDQYANCPVKAFNTESIDFMDMPLSRYYVADFCELVCRFSCLINPILHLQRQVQGKLPSQSFWDMNDRADMFNRKLGLEFFMMQKVHVFLRGEPPFRESCDLLLPDALGSEAIKSNINQWKQRVPHVVDQVKVWGNQKMPEPELAVDCVEKPGTTYTKAASQTHAKTPEKPKGPVPHLNLVHAGQPGSPMHPGQTMQPGQHMQPGQTMQPGQPMQPGQTMQPGQPMQPGQTMLPGQPPSQPMVPGQQTQGLPGSPVPTSTVPGAPMQPGQPGQLGALPQVPGQPAALPQVPGQPGALPQVPGQPGAPAHIPSQPGVPGVLPAGPGAPVPTSPMGAATMYPSMSTGPSGSSFLSQKKALPGIIETGAPDGDLNQVPGWLREYVTIPVKPKTKVRRNPTPMFGPGGQLEEHGPNFRQTY